MPQLALSLPLALGVATHRVSFALAFLAVVEAFAIWQWWLALHDPMHLARVSEHFTVNLAIGGCLLLLPLRGSGRYTLDELMKKHD